MTLCAVFAVHWLSLEGFRKNFFPIKKPYFEVRLLNRCLLHERYFSIEILGKEEKFYFQNSRSKVFAKKGDKVRLLMDSKYIEKFNHQNYKYIEQGMSLIAECNFDTSIQKALTSIRGKFSAD
jgi:hypothetical protein